MVRHLQNVLIALLFAVDFGLAGVITLQTVTTPTANAPVMTTLNTTESFYKASVKVRTALGSGSGLEGSYRGVHGVLTAAHVVWDYDTRTVLEADVADVAEDGVTARDAKLLAIDVESDLAFLRVSGEAKSGLPDLTPVNDLRVGEDVWYAGYGADTRCWLEKSIVARPLWKKHGVTGFLVTGKGYYGSSGSGVFVDRGGRKMVAGVISRWAADSGDCYAVCPLAACGPKDILVLLNKAHGKTLHGPN